MKEITIYVADDGTQFNDLVDCEWYELLAKFPALKEITFYDCYGCLMEIHNYDKWYEFDQVLQHHDYITIPTENALAALLATDDFFGLPCALKEYVNSTGTWKWRIGVNEDGFRDHEEYIKAKEA